MENKINKRLIRVCAAILVAVFVGFGVSQFENNVASGEGKNVHRADPPPGSPHESSQDSPRHSPASSAKRMTPGSSVSPELAKSRIEKFFSGERDLLKRTKFACDLIKQLCLNGHSEEAFELLDPNYGMVRSNEIAALFTHADLTKSELLRRVEEVSIYEGDKEGAIRGYIGRLELSELVESISDPEFQSVSRMNSSAFSFHVATALQVILSKSEDQSTASSPEFLETSKKLVDKGYLKPFDFVRMAAENSSVDAFERWKQIQEVIPTGTLTNGSGNWAGNPGQSLVSQMVMSDGPRTLNNLLKVEDYRSVDHAITQWTHSDPSGATKWYESNAGKLTPNQSNAVSSAFASTALSSAEFDVARAWAEKMQDPQSKEDLLEKISEQEKKVLADRAEREKKAQEGAGQ